MSTADNGIPVDLLDVIPSADPLNLADDAALFDSLDECQARSVVRNRQPEGVFRLFQVRDLLRLPFDMREDEVIQPKLTAKEVAHVDFVGV